MARLDPQKLHVKIDKTFQTQDQFVPRKYTLTHSDVTGELFLTIGKNYDHEAKSGWYKKLMRDEVLGEWINRDEVELHIHLHVSGGLVLGLAKWRESIFKSHLPLVLEAICYGDRAFLQGRENCLQAPILVHFHAKQTDLDHIEQWGSVKDYLPR